MIMVTLAKLECMQFYACDLKNYKRRIYLLEYISSIAHFWIIITIREPERDSTRWARNCHSETIFFLFSSMLSPQENSGVVSDGLTRVKLFSSQAPNSLKTERFS